MAGIAQDPCPRVAHLELASTPIGTESRRSNFTNGFLFGAPQKLPLNGILTDKLPIDWPPANYRKFEARQLHAPPFHHGLLCALSKIPGFKEARRSCRPLMALGSANGYRSFLCRGFRQRRPWGISHCQLYFLAAFRYFLSRAWSTLLTPCRRRFRQGCFKVCHKRPPRPCVHGLKLIALPPPVPDLAVLALSDWDPEPGPEPT